MTDPKPDTKPMWRRHRGACNQRVFNDPIDWEGHLRNCPYDIRQKLQKLQDALDELNLAERLDALEQADPATDPFAVEDSDPDEQRFQYADDYTDADHEQDEQPEDEDPAEQPRRLTATDFYGGVS